MAHNARLYLKTPKKIFILIIYVDIYLIKCSIKEDKIQINFVMCLIRFLFGCIE